MPSRTTFLILALALAAAVLPRAASAQRTAALPVANLRFEVPLGFTAEAGLWLRTSREPDGASGPAVTGAIGQHGWRATVGTRTMGMMAVQYMAHAVVLRTWDDAIWAPGQQTYLGAEARAGVLLTSVGIGALVHVTGNRGDRPVRLLASVGVGL